MKTLCAEIADILNTDRGCNAVIMGVGHLGQSLMYNFDFAAYGYKLLAAFEADDQMIGTRINGIPVLDHRQLEEFAAEHVIHAAILTVPQNHAAETADHLVAQGVKGIWNLTPHNLEIDDPSVKVENFHFEDSLLSLSYMMTGNVNSENCKAIKSSRLS